MSNVLIGGSLTLSVNNEPTRVGQRVSTESDIANIPAPFIGLIVYIEDQDSFVYVKSLKSRKVGNFEIKNALVDEYKPLSSGGGEFNLKWINVL